MIWLGVAILLALAALFLRPLLRREAPPGQTSHGQGERDRRAQNVALYQAYRDEVSDDPRLSEAERQELLAERARALLADVQEATAAVGAPAQVPGKSPRWLFGAALVVLVIGSVGLYQLLGRPQANALLETAEILRLPPAAPGEDQRLRTLTAQVRARVDAAPDDAGSLYLLGIGELKLGAYEPAAAAFERASGLVGEDPNLDLFWLQARFLADSGRITTKSEAIVQRVLGRDPNQPLALELLAIAAMQGQQFDAAVGLLNRALAGPLSLERRQSLSRGFETARQSLGVVGPTIDVVIELDRRPPQDAVLFVIARPVGGGIPYAVVRRPAVAIPERVRLDDAVSMNPANRLSSSPEVEVVVRLSLTGEVRAAAGDWQWRSDPVALTEAAEQAVKLQARLAPTP